MDNFNINTNTNTSQRPQSRQPAGCLVAFLWVMALWATVTCLFVAYQRFGPATAATDPYDLDNTAASVEFEAWQMSKRFVTKYLLSPSTADFAYFDESRVIEVSTLDSQKQYRVVSHVDSPNGLGVMVRSHWSAQVAPMGSSWRLDHLVIDGKTVFAR